MSQALVKPCFNGEHEVLTYFLKTAQRSAEQPNDLVIILLQHLAILFRRPPKHEAC